METILEIKGINKYYGKKHVLKDVSFSLKEGEILGFIGPNGAGKTTTIKLILGLQSMNSGEVFINGFNVKSDFERAISKVGAIVESPDLYMYLSGKKNLQMIANLYPDITKERIDEVVKLVGLEARINDKVSKYSLGMRQRLGIAAALIHSPKLLILDEPTNGLDPEGIKEIRDLMKTLAKKEKMGILISSHNLSELETMVTDVCLIQNGEVLAKKSISEMKTGGHARFVFKLNKITGLNKIMNDYKMEVEEKNLHVECVEEDVPKIVELLVENKYKVYGIKEETISLEEAFLQKMGGNKIV